MQKHAWGIAGLVGVVFAIYLGVSSFSGNSAGDKPPFDTAVLSGRGEVEIINLWDFITDDCRRQGVQGVLPSGTVVGVTLVRNDCTPAMYFVGTGRTGQDGWVSEDFLIPQP